MRSKRLAEIFKFWWDCIVILVTTYLAVYLPLQLAFNNASGSAPSFTIGWVSFVFFLDIGVNFYFLRYHKRQLVAEENSVQQYLRGGFGLDLVAAIPWGLIFGNPLLHLLMLCKISTVLAFFNRVQQEIVRYASFWMFVIFIFWFTLTAHWLSCGWISITNMASDDWYVTYVDALYWCITTMTTVGYGDIVPEGSDQKLFTILVEILGVGLYGYLIGNVASLLSQTNPAKAKYQENMDLLASLLHFRKLPMHLQERIKEYYVYIWKRRLGFDEHALLESLPSALRQEVSIELKRDLIEQFPLFEHTDPKFIIRISEALNPLVVTPGELVFEAGSVGTAMYFVVQGELEVVDAQRTRVLASLEDGDFFGEIALITEASKRTATVVAKRYCDLYYLEQDDFQKIVKDFPAIGKAIREKADHRMTENPGD